MKRILRAALSSSSPPALRGFRRALLTDNRILENCMSLQKSDLKKHLSTKAGNLFHHAENQSTEQSRVILRDGNLITLPDPALEDETVTKTVLD